MGITFEAEFLKIMFNRYWRDYPWFMQLMQFALMIFIFMGFAAVLIGFVIPRMADISTDAINTVSENSPMHVIHGVMLAQFTGSLLLILIPAFLFAYATHPNPRGYLGLIKPKKSSQLLWVTLLMLGIIPLLLTIPEWIQQIDFGKAAERAQAENNRLTNALLKMNNFGDFLMAFTTLAILPAIGEEMMFRGVMMKMAAKRSRSIGMPILITTILFTWMHSNIYGMLSIFIAGCLLAIIYYLTSSLWCSILAHLINNGLQIVIMYIAGSNEAVQKMINGKMPLYITLPGLVVFGFSFYMLWKNRTPLPRTWVNDFTNEELDAITNSENNNREE
jgi:membrane protease YdiL (CAAX protease family)